MVFVDFKNFFGFFGFFSSFKIGQSHKKWKFHLLIGLMKWKKKLNLDSLMSYLFGMVSFLCVSIKNGAIVTRIFSVTVHTKWPQWYENIYQMVWFFFHSKPISELDLLHFRDSLYIILLPPAYKHTEIDMPVPCYAINMTDELQFGTHWTVSSTKTLSIVYFLHVMCLCKCISNA